MRQDLTDEERLIVALDVDDVDVAITVLDAVDGLIRWVKVPYSLLTSPSFPKLAQELSSRGVKYIADLKTLSSANAVRDHIIFLKEFDPSIISVMYQKESMGIAAAYKENSGVITPILLTLNDRRDIFPEASREEFHEILRKRLDYTLGLGFEGVVTSGRELKFLRQAFGNDFHAIVPGIRDDVSELTNQADNQKRAVTILQAFESGADQIIVGRPIISATDPRAVTERILERIGFHREECG